MKKLLFESNAGDTVSWDPKDMYLVSKPPAGGMSGGVGGDSGGDSSRVPIHWPETVDVDSGSIKQAKKGQTPDDIITNPRNLTPDQRKELNDKLSAKSETQDKHINKDLTPGVQDSLERREQVKRQIQAIKKIAKAAEAQANGGKSLSGEWGRADEILTLHQGMINWKERLKAFFRPWISKKMVPTYHKLNTRDRTMYAGPPPIIRPGEKRSVSSKKLCIFIALDTSGSVDTDMLSSFVSEIKGIFTQNVCRDSNIEVRVIEWTGEITKDTLITQYNMSSYFSNAARTASGSTNFEKIKPYIESGSASRLFEPPVAVVYCTDGGFDATPDQVYMGKGRTPCANLCVIPDGLSSAITAMKKLFGVNNVLPMRVFDIVRS